MTRAAVLGSPRSPRTGRARRPALLDEPRRLGGVVVLVEVGDEHVGALAREGQRDGAADAAVAAGDDGRVALELPLPR